MLRAARRIGTALLLLVLGGCAVGPDFVKPGAPPVTTYTASSGETAKPLAAGPDEPQQRYDVGGEISQQWWQLFRSSALSDAVGMAIAGSPTLDVAEATLAQARESVLQAEAAFYPQLDLNAGATRTKTASTPQRGHANSAFDLFSLGGTLVYSPDVFGGTRRQVEQQEALAESQEQQLAAAYLTLTGNVVQQAIAIAGTRLEIAASEQIIAEDRRNLDLVRAKFDAGKAAWADVLTTDSQLANDQALLPPLRQQLSAADHALSVLVGKLPAEWSPPPFELASLELPGELPVRVPSELVHQRPDILAAEAELHAASAAVGVATAQLYPSITLTASAGFESMTGGGLFDAASSLYNLGAGLTQPLFHGGALLSQRRAAIDAFQASLATYRQTILQAFGQVADTLDALAHDADLVAAQRHALDVADASVSLAQLSYSAGKSSFLQLIDAQRLDQQARLGYARAATQRFQDTTQLFVVMGGPWWQPEPRESTAGASSAG